MRRVRIVKDTPKHKKGDVLVMDNNEAFGLIDSGAAILTKDMTQADYKTNSDEQTSGVKHGKPSILRTDQRFGR